MRGGGNGRPARAGAEFVLAVSKNCTSPHLEQENGCTTIPILNGAIRCGMFPSPRLGWNSTTGVLCLRIGTEQFGHFAIFRRIDPLSHRCIRDISIIVPRWSQGGGSQVARLLVSPRNPRRDSAEVNSSAEVKWKALMPRREAATVFSRMSSMNRVSSGSASISRRAW